MNKWILGILVFLLSLVPLTAGAQTAVTNLSSVQVDLWPDLDQAAVLVLITANLPAGTGLPATVQFSLPGEPSAVAYVSEDGQMLNAPFETLSEGEDTLIEIEAPATTIRIEYYTPYSRTGDDVRFTYRWLGGVAADQLVLMFREPSLATEVTPDASFQDAGIFPDGQRYYQRDVGAVGADEIVTAEFAYVGPPPVLSSTSSGAATTPVEKESSATLPVVLAGAGGLLVGAGLGWALSHQRRTVRRVPQRAKPAQAGYCHGCGARLKSGDAFCRQCGTKLR